jgi:hypothetical protein
MKADKATGHHEGTLHVLDHTGDTPVMWDTRKPDTVEEVRAKFNELIKAQGCAAFATTRQDERGLTGTQLREFDPAAERIIVTRPLQGG